MPLINGTDSAYSSDTNTNLNTQRASGMLTDEQNQVGSLPVTTTNISVYANGMRVGLIQSLSPSESRNIVKVRELGTEGVVQSVPSNTQGGQLQVSRFALYNSNLWRALGLTATGKFALAGVDTTQYNVQSNPFKTLRHQRVPLEISVKTTLPGDSGVSGTYEEVYLDCWLSSYNKTISSGTITITESATIQYSDAIFKGTKLPYYDPGATGVRSTSFNYSPTVFNNNNTNS